MQVAVFTFFAHDLFDDIKEFSLPLERAIVKLTVEHAQVFYCIIIALQPDIRD